MANLDIQVGDFVKVLFQTLETDLPTGTITRVKATYFQDYGALLEGDTLLYHVEQLKRINKFRVGDKVTFAGGFGNIGIIENVLIRNVLGKEEVAYTLKGLHPIFYEKELWGIPTKEEKEEREEKEVKKRLEDLKIKPKFPIGSYVRVVNGGNPRHKLSEGTITKVLGARDASMAMSGEYLYRLAGDHHMRYYEARLEAVGDLEIEVGDTVRFNNNPTDYLVTHISKLGNWLEVVPTSGSIQRTVIPTMLHREEVTTVFPVRRRNIQVDNISLNIKIKEIIFNRPATILFYENLSGERCKVVAKCHPNDYFCKNKGIEIAIRKAFIQEAQKQIKQIEKGEECTYQIAKEKITNRR